MCDQHSLTSSKLTESFPTRSFGILGSVSRLVMRPVPVSVPRLAVVVVMVMPPLVSAVVRRVSLGDDELRAVLGSLALVAAMSWPRSRRLVKLLPRLSVVAVQATSRLRRGRIERGHGVAVG